MIDAQTDPMQQAIDAATHARVLLLRDNAIETVNDDILGMYALTNPAELPEVYRSAIEMLAMLSSEELEHLADLVRQQRHKNPST